MEIDLDAYEMQAHHDPDCQRLLQKLSKQNQETAIRLMRLAFLDGVEFQFQRERARVAAK